VLVLRGEAGRGKSALLDFILERASGFRVARVVGAESEMELAYAGLHQLCAPTLDRVEKLPAPQRDALRVAFGLQEGDAPDRFLIGLAVLTLLAGAAEAGAAAATRTARNAATARSQRPRVLLALFIRHVFSSNVAPEWGLGFRRGVPPPGPRYAGRAVVGGTGTVLCSVSPLINPRSVSRPSHRFRVGRFGLAEHDGRPW
jgi:hypothetical protein